MYRTYVRREREFLHCNAVRSVGRSVRTYVRTLDFTRARERQWFWGPLNQGFLNDTLHAALPLVGFRLARLFVNAFDYNLKPALHFADILLPNAYVVIQVVSLV
jgi:hypothetical protein